MKSFSMNYITEKRMEKLYEKMRARKIAFGRKLIKIIKDLYGMDKS